MASFHDNCKCAYIFCEPVCKYGTTSSALTAVTTHHATATMWHYLPTENNYSMPQVLHYQRKNVLPNCSLPSETFGFFRNLLKHDDTAIWSALLSMTDINDTKLLHRQICQQLRQCAQQRVSLCDKKDMTWLNKSTRLSKSQKPIYVF